MSLSGNTEKINELLSKINALPEAGSGGGSGGGAIESCTVDFTDWGTLAFLTYQKSDMTTVFLNVYDLNDEGNGSHTVFLEDVAKGSMLLGYYGDNGIDFELTNAELTTVKEAVYGEYVHFFKITGDATISG